MKLESFLERRCRVQDRRKLGPTASESPHHSFTTFLPGAGGSPLEFSKRWIWKEWSFTGSDPSKHSYVYVMCKSARLHKIGTSNDPIRRVAELTSFNKARIWLAGMWVHPQCGRVEQYAHRLLAGKEAPFGREWFSVTRGVAFEAVMASIEHFDTSNRAF